MAATIGPGLIGSLLVGVSAAKAYSLAWGIPFVGVNHLEGHLHAAFLEDPDLALPAVVLLVSGGHTLLIAMERDGRYRLLGQTIDDAAGEAFDKVARFLGLGYPGGPAIDREARSGDPKAVAFPRGLRHQGLDFSFSGLKTSVIRHVKAHPELAVADVAASFQEAVVDILVEKTRAAAESIGAQGICIGGGVAANSSLRERIIDAAASTVGGPSSPAGPCAPTTRPWSGPPPGTACGPTGRRRSTPRPTPTCGCLSSAIERELGPDPAGDAALDDEGQSRQQAGADHGQHLQEGEAGPAGQVEGGEEVDDVEEPVDGSDDLDHALAVRAVLQGDPDEDQDGQTDADDVRHDPVAQQRAGQG